MIVIYRLKTVRISANTTEISWPLNCLSLILFHVRLNKIIRSLREKYTFHTILYFIQTKTDFLVINLFIFENIVKLSD